MDSELNHSSATNYILLSSEENECQTASRKFVMVLKTDNKKCFRPCKGSLLDDVKRRFENECTAFKVDPIDQLYFIHLVIRDDTLSYFEDNIVQTAPDNILVFDMLRKLYINDTHRETCREKWQTSIFRQVFNGNQVVLQLKCYIFCTLKPLNFRKFLAFLKTLMKFNMMLSLMYVIPAFINPTSTFGLLHLSWESLNTFVELYLYTWS